MRKRSIKVFLVRRRVVAVLAALALAAGIFYAVSYPGSVSAAAAKRQLPIYSVERTDGKFCSISFDAAWGNEDTQILIDILARYDIKATFFVVGDWAEKYPESVKALHDAGHEVMSHSNHHDHYNTLTAEQIIADVTASNERISASTAVCSMGMEPIQWDVDSLDWKDYDAPTICKRVTSKLAPGSIVLFHNAALHTPEALPEILECMIREGYTVLPISQLILHESYTIDHTGRQFAAQTDETGEAAS